MAEIAQKNLPQTELCSIPIADGGEGTVDALVLATGGRKETVCVTGPMGKAVNAAYGILHDGQTVVIEMAQASGLSLIDCQKANPLHATSLGIGEILAYVLDKWYRKILIGLGGSATNDGGMGFLTGMGAGFMTARAIDYLA